MARKRMIEPDIWSDEGFIELPWEGRLLFIGLISQADDEGRGTGSAKSIKAKIFPADDITIDTIKTLKAELEKHVNVKFYEVDGQEYYELGRWRDHQSIEKKGVSHIPKFTPKEERGESRNGEPSKTTDPGLRSIQSRLMALATSQK